MMENIIIIGEEERKNNFILGKYRVNLDIVADADVVLDIREDLDYLANSQEINFRTKHILNEIAEQLKTYEVLFEEVKQ